MNAQETKQTIEYLVDRVNELNDKNKQLEQKQVEVDLQKLAEYEELEKRYNVDYDYIKLILMYLPKAKAINQQNNKMMRIFKKYVKMQNYVVVKDNELISKPMLKFELLDYDIKNDNICGNEEDFKIMKDWLKNNIQINEFSMELKSKEKLEYEK